MPPISLKQQLDLRERVFELCHLRGYTQRQAGQVLGITQPRVSQILNEAMRDFKERVEAGFESPKQALLRKLEQYEIIRREAWLSWERSKEDQEWTTQEQNLRTIYKVGLDGTKVHDGEKLKIVKEIRKAEGRLPANEYLATVIRCLVEEAKLEGLTQELSVKVFNNNVAGDQQNVAISWDPMLRRPPDVDDVEGAIALAAEPMPPTTFTLLDVGKVVKVTEQPIDGWTEAEKETMGDEPEHLNGDGA